MASDRCTLAAPDRPLLTLLTIGRTDDKSEPFSAIRMVLGGFSSVYIFPPIHRCAMLVRSTDFPSSTTTACNDNLKARSFSSRLRSTDRFEVFDNALRPLHRVRSNHLRPIISTQRLSSCTSSQLESDPRNHGERAVPIHDGRSQHDDCERGKLSPTQLWILRFQRMIGM
jgi:hypothetical protein